MDDAQATAFVRSVEQAWNTHDMRAFAGLFAEDADFVNVGGWWYRGRREIEENHAVLHASIFSDSTMTLQLAALKPVTHAVDVIHVKWEMAGHDASGVEVTTDRRRGIWSWVIRDLDGKREIVAAHNTDTLPAPPGHPLEHLKLR